MLKIKYLIPLMCLLSSHAFAQVIVDQREPINMVNDPYNPVMAAAADQSYPYSPIPTQIYPFNPKTQSFYSYSTGDLSGNYYNYTGRAGCSCQR